MCSLIWNHNGHDTEQNLWDCSGKEVNITYAQCEIVWQFGVSGISRIHCDTHKAGWFEGDSDSFEDKGTEVSNDNSLNGQDLLGYHGQYLASGG